jgi:hypothetical protein
VPTVKSLLDKLIALSKEFGRAQQSHIASILSRLRDKRIVDASELIRLHEAVLFIRAYPPSARIARLADQILQGFESRIIELPDRVDLAALDDPEVSGIAGGAVTSNFSYPIARWLVAKYPAQVSIDWDWFDEEDRFGATMPRFLPLLAEDAMVEAHVPYREWLGAAKGNKRELVWLIERFESLQLPDKVKANLYDSLKLHITWAYGLRSSRSGMRLPVRKLFVHSSPLIRRREVSLTRELLAPPLPVARLSPAQGEKILKAARETSAVRYRELHGFTYGDVKRVLKAELGRGTTAYVMGVPAANRLPLRAYHAAMIFKNGVPVGYFEGLSICERMESGFNLYYTFRDGETAWLYARILRLMRQLLGVTVFSIDPYQVGHENEEGIESGAFWFYRKLGFRPVKPELLKLTEAEEARVAKDPRHRTSPATLRKLAAGHMLFSLSGSNNDRGWDDFEIRKIGLAVQRRLARNFHGNAAAMRQQSLATVGAALGKPARNWSQAHSTSVEDLSLVLAMIPGLNHWSSPEKKLATRIVRAKLSADESLYLKLMQKHAAFRGALIRLGCD